MGIRVRGLNEHQQANENRLNKLLDLTPVMDSMSAEYISSISPKRFRDQKTPEGVKWAKLALESERALERKFGDAIPGGILRRKGDLMRSVQRKVHAKGFAVFTNHISAATHQFGRGGIPARKFLGFSRSTLKRWNKRQEKFIASKERKR